MATVLLRNGIGSPPTNEQYASEQYRPDLERPWWSQTARDVRESDEAKIRDYKEDIDTLLVFGALFSAVITALVIESYSKLSPDTAELTLQAMVQISLQLSSYTTTGQSHNSTAPAFVIPNSSTTSRAMIIVNVAWFGSLTLSLMAASYGMLVKQWLREYLAYQNASPLARLRLRCIRYPALAKWGVFEIVAVLPLLLQAALGLFFLGLCFFASTIHPAIAWTIIPLVIVWVFLFLTATIAPVFSPRCPYKTTFLKDFMKKLRRFIFFVAQKMKNPSLVVPPGPEEEEDLARDNSTDFDVLAKIDTLHQDDGLIAPALVDLGRQVPGPDVVRFLFAILQNRDPLVERKKVDCLVDLRNISIPLLSAAVTALFASLRQAYTRHIASPERLLQTSKQYEWAHDAFPILLSALSDPLLDRPSQPITDYLSMVTPDFVDNLVEPIITKYSTKQQMAFLKQLVQYIDPSSKDSNNLRPLRMRNLSQKGWDNITKFFESLIFHEATTATSSSAHRQWNHDMRIGFRGLFGVSSHGIPHDTSQRIHDAFDDSELIKQLLRSIPATQVSGHAHDVTFYIFRLLPNGFSSLSEHSWPTVQNLLVLALEDELDRLEGEADSRKDSQAIQPPMLSAIQAILSMSRWPRSDKAMGIVLRWFDFDCEELLNKIPGGVTQAFVDLISLLTHLLTGQSASNLPESWIGDSLLIRDPRNPQLDIVADVAALSLSHILRLPNQPETGGSLASVRLAFRMISLCSSFPQNMTQTTVSDIVQLLQSYVSTIFASLPIENGRPADYALSSFWATTRWLSRYQELSVIRGLCPTTYTPDVAEKLLQVRDYVQSAQSLDTDVSGILFSFIESYGQRAEMLQPFAQLGLSTCAWQTVETLAYTLVSSMSLSWFKWMKFFLIDALKVPEFHHRIKLSIIWDILQFVALIASHDIECLDHFPLELGPIIREKRLSTFSVLFPLGKHPEPLSPDKAEDYFMQVILNAGIEKPVYAFSTLKGFWLKSNALPPRYACISFALRVLRYCLGPKGVYIPTNDIRTTLDLSKLEKEVWDDVSSAAAEVITRKDEEFHRNGKLVNTDVYSYGNGAALGRTRLKAIMILLADSPYPFFTDRSYEALHQTRFFRWEECPEVGQDTRWELERRRQRRIEEGQRSGRFYFPVTNDDRDEETENQSDGGVDTSR